MPAPLAGGAPTGRSLPVDGGDETVAVWVRVGTVWVLDRCFPRHRAALLVERARTEQPGRVFEIFARGVDPNEQPPELDGWEIVPSGDGSFYFLRGRVSRDPRFEDGEAISTSRIQAFDRHRRLVTTKSGYRYLLREAAPHVHAGRELRALDAHLKEPF